MENDRRRSRGHRRMAVVGAAALLDRVWRRSGCFLYKPDMEKTCCPSYTIRLKASDFVLSKEQGQVSRRMKRIADKSDEPKKHKVATRNLDGALDSEVTVGKDTAHGDTFAAGLALVNNTAQSGRLLDNHSFRPKEMGQTIHGEESRPG